MTAWQTLQSLAGHYAVSAEWAAGMGDTFSSFTPFLQRIATPAQTFPCPRGCGCTHEIMHGRDGAIYGICRCELWRCDDLTLTPDDIVLWELNWPKFARALCTAFGFNSKLEDYGPPDTVQIGTWSADAVPVILTIQWDEHEFRHVVASLVARQHSPFILLAPTSDHLDATSLGYLANVGAEFFSLETHLILTEHGTFQPTKLPGEIFARFRPEPTDDEELLRKAILLVMAADSGQGARKVTLYMIMRLFCFDCLSKKQIARRCGCALSLVYSRLEELQQKLGREPDEFRKYADQFERIAESLSEPRAKRMYRKGAVYGDEGQGETKV